MRYILLLILCSGCVATSSHVDKSERLAFTMFDFILKDSPEAKDVLNEYKRHIDEGSGAKINPDVVGGLADGLIPGLGFLVTTALGVYARKKHTETKYVTKKGIEAANEPDPIKARNILSSDRNVKHFNDV